MSDKKAERKKASFKAASAGSMEKESAISKQSPTQERTDVEMSAPAPPLNFRDIMENMQNMVGNVIEIVATLNARMERLEEKKNSPMLSDEDDKSEKSVPRKKSERAVCPAKTLGAWQKVY